MDTQLTPLHVAVAYRKGYVKALDEVRELLTDYKTMIASHQMDLKEYDPNDVPVVPEAYEICMRILDAQESRLTEIRNHIVATKPIV